MNEDSSNRIEVTTDRARQGVTGHNVRYVLAIGLVLPVLAGIMVYWLVP